PVTSPVSTGHASAAASLSFLSFTFFHQQQQPRVPAGVPQQQRDDRHNKIIHRQQAVPGDPDAGTDQSHHRQGRQGIFPDGLAERRFPAFAPRFPVQHRQPPDPRQPQQQQLPGQRTAALLRDQKHQRDEQDI